MAASLLHLQNSETAPDQDELRPVRHILVADDDSDILHLDTCLLVQSGYHVDTAGDGLAAWQALNSVHYDLLITDHRMPRMSGVELLKQLHAAHLCLPVIMATGTLPEFEFDQSPWLRPTAVLLKPYSMEELLGTVAKVLKEKTIQPKAVPVAGLLAPRQLSPDIGQEEGCSFWHECRGCN